MERTLLSEKAAVPSVTKDSVNEDGGTMKLR